MVIGIDARMFGPEQAGLGRYIEQLIRHVERIDEKNQYVLFFSRHNWDAFEPSGDHMKKVLADIPWYGFREQFRFPKLIRRHGVDLMHFPHWNVPVMYRRPFIVTVHDLIMQHFPRQEATTHGPVMYWLKQGIARFVLKSAVKRAKHMMTTSEFTKQDIAAMFHIPAERMTVTYQAPFFFEPHRPPSAETLPGLGITKPYVLYVGNAYPHKNLDRLIMAWRAFVAEHGDGCQLVLAGKINRFYETLIERYATENDPTIVHTGFVSDIVLQSLYANAHAFVYPSLYEGFGLPPLEAMACGIPVLASSASCLPEVLGEGALYVNPESVEHIAIGLHQIIADEAIRDRLKSQARLELRRYSWGTLASKTLRVYESVLYTS